jgi:HPt (histidine-containing phosphotransfer) domain-containing protein
VNKSSLVRTPVAAALEATAARFSAKLPQRLSGLEADCDALTADTLETALPAIARQLHDLAGTARLLGYPALGSAARDAEQEIARMRSQVEPPTCEQIAALRSAIRELRASAGFENA